METNVYATIPEGSHCTTKDGKPTDVWAPAAIDFMCNLFIFGSGEPPLLVQLPPGSDGIDCRYMFEWRTHVSGFDFPSNVI